MFRILFFFIIIILPLIFSWWLFVPLTMLFVYLAKLPYEITVAGAILDVAYNFGDSIIDQHLLLIFSVVLLILATFLNNKVYWRKII